MPKHLKPLNDKPNYKQSSQYDVEKGIKPDKIDPKKIFDGYKDKDNKKKKK